MDNKPESALDAITSLGSTFVRMISSGGESVKATVANVAKYIIETYASSSLAGSNQSVKSAIDSLNSKTSGIYYRGKISDWLNQVLSYEKETFNIVISPSSAPNNPTDMGTYVIFAYIVNKGSDVVLLGFNHGRRLFAGNIAQGVLQWNEK